MIRLIPSRFETAVSSTGRLRSPLRFMALYRYFRFRGQSIRESAVNAWQIRAK